MSYNLVVLTDDLGKKRGGATLRVGETTTSTLDTEDNPTIDSNTIFKGRFKNIGADDSVLSYIFDMSPPGDNGFLFRFSGDGSHNLEFIMWTTEGVRFARNQAVDINIGDVCDYELTLSGGNINIRINGVDDLTPFTGIPVKPISTTMTYGTENDGNGANAHIEIYSCSVTGSHSYNMNGQFGNTTVLDSSAYGNDGILTDTTWWKADVDQVFANATLFNNQLPITPVEFQKVIDIGTGAPPTGDIFYDPYGAEDLVVTVQSSVSTYNLKSTGIKNKIALEN